MTQENKDVLNLTRSVNFETDTKANLSHRRWNCLCEIYLPVKTDNSIWRYNRETKNGEPSQGWKIHISATILEACDLFEQVAPLLISQDVQFKAPKSLDELSKINCGLQYGYSQVGKFITVYCPTEKQVFNLAQSIHQATGEFTSIPVPFDEQYAPDSSVFYRYGAFASIEMTDKNGKSVPAIKNPAGELVYDDRLQAIPKWIADPFQTSRKSPKETNYETENPLITTYKVFRAITQRGKGGAYQAFDLSSNPPRFCILKEGRRYGELSWNGQDGYDLVKNEFLSLKMLRKNYEDVPEVYSSFELSGNFYFVMEYVEGKNLYNLLKFRKRRFSIRQVIIFALEIAKILKKIHNAGWVWNDCKPANLIVNHQKHIRPIDFENAYPIDQTEPFEWRTPGFSKPFDEKSAANSSGISNDLFAMGAVLYFLLTGRLYDAEAPVEIKKLRRNVPAKLTQIIENLLSDSVLEKQTHIDVIIKTIGNIRDRL